MEKRRIKAKVIQRHRIRPWSADIGCGNKIIECIIHIAVERLHYRINQIKYPLIISKAGAHTPWEGPTPCKSS